MRIISGSLRGRTLKVPDPKYTRPTTDRVRETIFNILNNIIDFDLLDVLDIYSGSGSFGLEALSRGAATVDFIEKNFPVFKVLSQNIEHLGVGDKCRIYKMEAVAFTRISEHKKYDLIFADPPFFRDDIHTAAKNIMERNFLSDEGIFLIERSIQTKQKDEENFGIEAFKRIGDTLLYRFEKSG